nr:ribonuclease H-like domain-containing protein [Tanacetum cinerariifolium]
MDSLSPQVVSAAKLPILNPNEFDLWKMRIEQYFLMTDYSLWEVILNGDSPVPTRIVEVKARFGGNAESKKMRKSMLKQEFLEFRIGEAEGLHKGYDKMQKILKQQLAYEYLEQIEKLDLEEMDLKWQMAMLSVRVHKFEQKARRKIDFDKKESAMFNKNKVRCYNCQQRGYFSRECRANGGNDKQRYSSFKIKEIGKKEEDSKALIIVDTLVDWTNHDNESDEVIDAKEFGIIVGCDSEDAIKDCAAKLYNLITGANSEEANTAGDAGEFTLMGVTSETKLDNHLVQTKKWRNSSKNLFKLIDSSMSVRTKMGLGFTNCRSKNKLGWDDSTFNVFTTKSKDVKGRPMFHRFAKTDSMKAVPLPLTGDYTYLSDHTDLDESQMSYGTKSSSSCNPKYVPNDFVSHDDSDKSSEVNTNDFASSDSSVKSLEHKPTDSTSCASSSSVSTSVNEAEIESNVGTPIKEPVIVQDLPSFTCNSSDKNEHTSRTSCNKNGYFNKKAGYFRKNASSVSKLCFVCGSGTHLIKDFDFYETQMANKTIGIGEGPVYNSNKVNYQNQFVPQAILLRTSKVNISPVKPQPVPTGKPKVTPVPTGRPNRHFLVPTDRGYSPLVISSWWSSTVSPMSHLINPTSSYFQTYTPYVPTMYSHHMKNGRDIRATAVKPSAVVLKKHIEKETPFSATKDEGIFDSGCSRSMTGNKERLDDFQAFHGGKVTFGGCEGRITGKGKIHTPTLDFENDFKLPDDNMVVLKVPRKHNLCTINLNDLCPRGNLACLMACASFDESVKWHRRMAHVNYKNMNRLVTAHKDETYPILKDFINLIENQLNKKVKAIRCDNVRTACYVLNRVSVTSPHNKTPYALLTGNIPSVSHFKPFGCHVTILNTSDHLGKFDGKLMKATLLVIL